MIKIVKADERLAAHTKINIALFGPSGVGKTTQARTLDPETTLFLDLEAGTLAIQDWAGDVVDIRRTAQDMQAHPWEIARALACLVSGPDPADADGAYSQTAYESYVKAFGGDVSMLAKYKTVFVDSITVASRQAFAWAQRQPEAFSEKTGKPDTRGAYGLLGREMIRWLTVLQHCPKDIILVGILDSEKDDLNRITHTPQVEGSKTGRELPGIFDQVVTLTQLAADDGTSYRAFVCHQQNNWNFPAKDRSGRLEMIEPPDLGKLIHKIRTGKRLDGTLATSVPAK
jgi:hypothetical protein